MRHHRLSASLVLVVGLAVGCLTSLGQRYLDTTLNPLVNSASAWLVAAFAVGACMATRRGAALAGLSVCLLQLVGYYVTAHVRGYPAGDSIIAFWAVCAAVGGPVFGVAGRIWRAGSHHLSGLGMAVLAGAFFAEGLWVYAHELHSWARTALWLGIGAVLALVLSRRRGELAWLALTVPVGVICEIALTRIYAQSV